jgi:hypothetical protein
MGLNILLPSVVMAWAFAGSKFMKTSSMVLTTIGNGIVAILETTHEADRKRGEFTLSRDCVRANIGSGQFVDVTHQVNGAEGKVYARKQDLNNV